MQKWKGIGSYHDTRLISGWCAMDGIELEGWNGISGHKWFR